jgi:ubiquitin thioesterase protein OTUB1
MEDDDLGQDAFDRNEKFGKEEVSQLALVDERKGLEALVESYKDNPLFLSKLEDLRTRKGAYRSVRPDGSCFYRAYGFGLFERMIESPETFKAVRERAVQSLDYTCEAGYDRMALEIFFETMVECIDTLAPGSSVKAVEEIWCSEDNNNQLNVVMRCICSAYLKHHRDDFVAYLDGYNSIDDFCRSEVDPVSKWADQLQIVALASYFQVPVRIHYLDQSPGNQCAEHCIPDGAGAGPFVRLLYRPGHYDMLYLE